MRKLSILGLSSLFTALILSGCKLDVEAKGTVVPQAESGPALTCSAMLSPLAGGSVESGVAAPIQVNASGGTAPYQILETAIAFQSETVIARSYQNNTNANLLVVDTASVTDTAGHVTQCNFVVTVTPVNAPPSDLACTMVANPTAPLINQNTAFTVTAQAGTAPYAFSNFDAGTQSTLVSALAPINSTQASATAKYSTSGLRSSSVTVTDSVGAQVSCATSVNVAPLPSVAVVASPATAVVFGNTITLTAAASNFSGTPSYSFSTDRAGVSITNVNNVASITSSLAQNAFNVVVTATSGSQQATNTISLSFLNPSSLPCTVSHSAGTYYPGDSVQFNVTATSGEALEITGFSYDADATLVSSTTASRTLSYPVAGTKTAYVTARSVATGALCQAGAVMSDSVIISPSQSSSLTCNGYTSVNPSYTYNWFVASATISGGQGLKWVDTITITKNGNNYYNFNGQWINSNSAWLSINTSGTYLIQFNLKDTYGNVGTCTTTQVVWY